MNTIPFEYSWKYIKTLKYEGKSRKNYKPRGGAKVWSILHSNGFLNSFYDDDELEFNDASTLLGH